MWRVLVVEDQKKHLASLTRGLESRGIRGRRCLDRRRRLAVPGHDRPSMPSILDLMLPGRDGLDVLREMRAHGLATPVLILTARDTVEDKVLGLDSGANDYLVKPFAFAELLARLRACSGATLPSASWCFEPIIWRWTCSPGA